MNFHKSIIPGIKECYKDPITKRIYDKEDIENYVGYISESNLDYVLGSPPYNLKRIVEKMFEEYDYGNYDAICKLEIDSIEDAKKIINNSNKRLKEKWVIVEKYIVLLSNNDYELYYEYCRLNNLIGFFHDEELENLNRMIDENFKFITIDAPWGSGKSTFIRRIKEDYVELGISCIYKDLTHEIALYDNEYTMVYDLFLDFINQTDYSKVFLEVVEKLSFGALKMQFPVIKIIKKGKERLINNYNKLESIEKQQELKSFMAKLSIKQQTDILINYVENQLKEEHIIILDELDRLDSNKIIKILNIVNYLDGRLSNLSFILSYNKDVVERRLQNSFDLRPEDRFLEKYTNNVITLKYKDNEWSIYEQLASYKKCDIKGNEYSIYNSYSITSTNKFKSYFLNLYSDSRFNQAPQILKNEILANFIRLDLMNSYPYKEAPLFRELLKLLSHRECEKYCVDIFNVITNFGSYIHKVDTGILYIYMLIKHVDYQLYIKIREKLYSYEHIVGNFEVKEVLSISQTDRDINFNKYFNTDIYKNTKLRESIFTLFENYGFYFNRDTITTEIKIIVNGEDKTVLYYFLMLNKYLSYIG